MFAFLSNFFTSHGIDTLGTLALSDCRILRPYLLERAGILAGNVLLIAVPYYSPACDAPERNLSAYAVPRDYHAYFDGLFGELLPQLKESYPTHRFAAFYDHSPIAEVEAAARAGLGCIGKNGLLLTERYSSYVFLAELITDAPLPSTAREISVCEDCGRCRAVCPAVSLGDCLSALTQKKGDLTTDEQAALCRSATVWGCDLCQEVCPHTFRAKKSGTIYTNIPYFGEETLPHLSLDRLDRMSDEEFSKRAYAWRGRKTIHRNLLLNETKNTQHTTEDAPC